MTLPSLAVGVFVCGLLVGQDPAGAAVAAAKEQLAQGRQAFRAGHLDEAGSLVGAAIVVLERHLPEQDLPAADANLVLGAIAGVREDLVTAARHYRRGLTLREQHEAAGAPYVQLLRFNLAASLQALGDSGAALQLAEAGLLAFAEKQRALPGAGNYHAVAALALDGLGRYWDAFDAYERALAILAPAMGESHRDVVRLRGLQGCVMCRLGRIDEGLAQLRAATEAMRADAAAPLPMRRELECALATMQLVHDGGATAVAEVRAQLQFAIAESERQVPGAASRLILLMSGLDLEDPEHSDLELADAALARVVADYGSDHPLYAASSANVARMYAYHGDRDRAAELYDRAIGIFDRNPCFLGVDRWRVQWARLTQYMHAGDNAAAEAIARRSLADLPHLLDAWAAPLDDGQRRELTSAARLSVDVAVQLARELDRPAASAWEPVLAWRALVARGFLQSLPWLQDHHDPASQALADELRATFAVIAHLQRTGSSAEEIAAAGARRDAVSARLSAQLAARAPAVTTPAAIAAALESDEVLVDLHAHVEARPAPAGGFTVTERLLAFVQRPGAAPVLVDLGPLADVVAAVDVYLRAASRWTKPSPTAAATIGTAGRRLAALVWQPWSRYVPAGARVLVSADSVLALVPWACLPAERADTFLVEEHEFVQIANPGDVVARKPWPALRADARLFVVGDLHYGAGAFAPLPRTAGEIDSVARAFTAAAEEAPVRLLRGDDATAERFGLEAAGATFVHVATHGWCKAPRNAPDFRQNWLGNGLFGRPQRRAAGADADEAAGIALSGACATDVRDPGCLGADALSRLDLSQCHLAVLSACETGLGTVSAGEGLLGLRRALRLAGARSSLTTVWRVEDAATARWMAAFYAALWTQGKPPAAALRAAQLAMLAALRADGGQACTGLWGGFVLEGR